jgi:Domain of unknown function (DUF5405)
LQIEIGEKYLVTSDEYNLVLREKKVSKEGKEYIVSLGYYGKLENLVSALFLREIKESEVSSLKELIAYLESAEKRLSIDIKKNVKAFREINIESPENKWF